MFFAYIEPSAVSYVIQAVAGIAIILGTVVGIVLTFLKRRAAKLLAMEEINKKEMEEDIIITDQKNGSM